MPHATRRAPSNTPAPASNVSGVRCRFCGSALQHIFVDLGLSPLCESYIEPTRLAEPEALYPLRVFICDRCFLVQLPEHVTPAEIFTEYAYFSSYSESWLTHARAYVEAIVPRLRLGAGSQVIEVASNDGYLLRHVLARGIPALGVEPAANVSAAAIAAGVPTVVKFFDEETARSLVAEGRQADLLVANNVLAQVPDLCGFVRALRILLKPGGVLTVEFPHLVRLVEGNQFDTIYHEHFSYFSFTTAEQVFAAAGLTVFDVDELPTHGGSLRLYARHAQDDSRPVAGAVPALRAREEANGYRSLDRYRAFAPEVAAIKRSLLDTLLSAKGAGKSIAGYGAPGKGNTLLNYCGIGPDLIDYTVDRNPYKRGKLTPGMRIPIHAPSRIAESRPDYLFILPWNLLEEIVGQMAFIRQWGGRFLVAIPEVRVLA